MSAAPRAQRASRLAPDGPLCSVCLAPIRSLAFARVHFAPAWRRPAVRTPPLCFTLAELARDPVLQRRLQEFEAQRRAACVVRWSFQHDDCLEAGGYAVPLAGLDPEGLLAWAAHLRQKLWYTDQVARGLLEAALAARHLLPTDGGVKAA